MEPWGLLGFPSGTVGKESSCQSRRCSRRRLNPQVKKLPWHRKIATHFSIPPWEMPWTEEPGTLQSMGSQKSRTGIVCEPRTSRCTSWIWKRQRNQRSDWQHHWIIEKARGFQENIYFCFTHYAKAFDCMDHNKVWKTLKEMEVAGRLTCLLRNLDASQEATVRTGHGTTDWSQIGKGVWQAVYRHLPLLLLMFSCSAKSDSAISWTAARQASLSFTISQSLLH